MNDALDLPGTTITLNRKDILRKLWSNYGQTCHASSADHACYFALLAALSRPENQQACLHNKLDAAFRPSTNAKRLANGYSPYLEKYNFNGIETPLRWLAWAGDEKVNERTKAQSKQSLGFLFFAYEFLQLADLRLAEALLKKEVR